MGIGVDQIPDSIRNSMILTGNNLGRLGNVENLPEENEVLEFGLNPQIQEMRIRFQNDPVSWVDHLHLWAKDELDAGNVEKAWLILLQKR